jgi:hypothetical protein
MAFASAAGFFGDAQLPRLVLLRKILYARLRPPFSAPGCRAAPSWRGPVTHQSPPPFVRHGSSAGISNLAVELS